MVLKIKFVLLGADHLTLGGGGGGGGGGVISGRPLIGTESTVLVRSGYSFVADEVKV